MIEVNTIDVGNSRRHQIVILLSINKSYSKQIERLSEGITTCVKLGKAEIIENV